MSQIFKFRTRSQIDEEAATWVWRMDSDSVSTANRDAFESWLRRDSRHRRAYENLTQVWTGLNGLAEAKRDAIHRFGNAGLTQWAGFRLVGNGDEIIK